MSNLLLAVLFPFLYKFHAVDPETPTPAAEENAAPAENAEGTVPEEQQPVAPRTYSEDEAKKLRDDEAAKIRNKYERKLDKLKIELETRAKIEQERAPVVQDDDEPQEEDFSSYSDYQKSLAKWAAKKAVLEVESRKQQESEQERQQRLSARASERVADIFEEGNKKYDDFDEMPAKTASHLKAKGLSLSRAFVNTMQEAENAPDIIAHLATNLDEAERIARLPEYAQAKEVGKLEDKLSKPAAKSVSKAPEPIKPVGTGKASNDTLSDEMSVEDWMRARNKQAGRR